MAIDPANLKPFAEGYGTPEQLKSAEDFAKYLLKQSQEQPVRHPLQGIANMTRALVGGWTENQAEEQQKKALQDQAKAFVSSFGSRPQPAPVTVGDKTSDLGEKPADKSMQVASLDGMPTPDTTSGEDSVSPVASPTLMASALAPKITGPKPGALSVPQPVPSAMGLAGEGGVDLNPNLLNPRFRVTPEAMQSILANKYANPTVAALMAQQFMTQNQNQSLDYPGVGKMYYTPEGKYLGLQSDIIWKKVKDETGREMEFPYAWRHDPASGRMTLQAIDLPFEGPNTARQAGPSGPPAPAIGVGARGAGGITSPDVAPAQPVPGPTQSAPPAPAPSAPAPAPTAPAPQPITDDDVPSLTLPGSPKAPTQAAPQMPPIPEPPTPAPKAPSGGRQVASADGDIAGLFNNPQALETGEGGEKPQQLAYTASDFFKNSKTKAQQAGEEAEATHDATEFRKAADTFASSGKSALSGINRVDEARRNLDNENFVWGPMAEPTLKARGVRAGIADTINKTMGKEVLSQQPGGWWDPNATRANDEFKKQMQSIAMQELKNAFGGLGQVRVAEIQMLSDALANQNYSPQANRDILGLLRRSFEDANIMGKIANAYERGVRWDAQGNPIRDANGQLVLTNERPTKRGLDQVISLYTERNPLMSKEEQEMLRSPDKYKASAPPVGIVPEANPPPKAQPQAAPAPPSGFTRKRY